MTFSNEDKVVMKDFSISDAGNGYDISAALYKEELNDLKIEKLSNRVTIISIIIPCLICAVLVFGYLDIKERLIDVHDTGQTEVKGIAKDFEAKLNAMDVQTAKLRFSIEKTIPDIKKQIIIFKEEMEKILSTKAGITEIDTKLDTLEKQINKNTDQYNGVLHILDRTNKETLRILNNTAKKITKKMDEEKNAVTATINGMEEKLQKNEDRLNTNDEALQKKLASLDSMLLESQTILTQLNETKRQLNNINHNIENMKKEFNRILKAKVEKKEMNNALSDLKHDLMVTIEKNDVSMATGQSSSELKKTKKQQDKNGTTIIIKDIKPGTIIEKDLAQ